MATENNIPTIVIDMDGGLINCITADSKVRVIVIDQDIEGTSDEVYVINGDEAVVSDHLLETVSESEDGGVWTGLAPNYVHGIVAELDAL